MPGCVELSRPDPETPKTSEPDTLRFVVDRSSSCPALRPPTVCHRLPFRGQEDELRTIRMKCSRQLLQKIDDPREHRNLAGRTRGLGRVILAGVATSRYRDNAPLQIDVIPSQGSGFTMAHAGPKQKEEPWTPIRLIVREPRQDGLSLIGVKGIRFRAMRPRPVEARKRTHIT